MFTSRQKKDETAREYISRIIHHLDYEKESYLDPLPTIQAIVDYFEMLGMYDVDFVDDVWMCIEEGEDITPLETFITTYKLRDKEVDKYESWSAIINLIDEKKK